MGWIMLSLVRGSVVVGSQAQGAFTQSCFPQLKEQPYLQSLCSKSAILLCPIAARRRNHPKVPTPSPSSHQSMERVDHRGGQASPRVGENPPKECCSLQYLYLVGTIKIGYKLAMTKFRLDIRRRFLTITGVGFWKSLPFRVVRANNLISCETI